MRSANCLVDRCTVCVEFYKIRLTNYIHTHARARTQSCELKRNSERTKRACLRLLLSNVLWDVESRRRRRDDNRITVTVTTVIVILRIAIIISTLQCQFIAMPRFTRVTRSSSFSREHSRRRKRVAGRRVLSKEKKNTAKSTTPPPISRHYTDGRRRRADVFSRSF